MTSAHPRHRGDASATQDCPLLDVAEHHQALPDRRRRDHRGGRHVVQRRRRASSCRSSGPRVAASRRSSTSSAAWPATTRAASRVAGDVVSGHASGDRHGVPGRVDVSVAQCARERRVSARNRRHGEAGAAGAGRALRVDGRPARFRAALSRRTVRRHAPACRARPHAGVEAEAAADGRAVRRARRADATAARRQGAADPAGHSSRRRC